MKTARQMIEDFNARHPDRAIAGPWKGSKDALRERIGEMEREVKAVEVDRMAAEVKREEPEAKPETAKEPRGEIGRAVEQLLLTGATYGEIVRQVRAVPRRAHDGEVGGVGRV